MLVAELIREYLEFYSLDYSKQIFLPETNLNAREAPSRETLVEQTGMNQGEVTHNKPLLLQLVEQFQQGGGGHAQVSNPSSIKVPRAKGAFPIDPSEQSSPNAAPGVQFSEEKFSRKSPPLQVGDGILGQQEQSPEMEEDNRSKNLQKAMSLLDDTKREEVTGYKAEIGRNLEDKRNAAKS